METTLGPDKLHIEIRYSLIPCIRQLSHGTYEELETEERYPVCRVFYVVIIHSSYRHFYSFKLCVQTNACIGVF